MVFVLLCFLAPLLMADTVTVKAKPEDYQAHMEISKVAIGAEYHAHTLPLAGTAAPLFAGEYLVIEIAVFPKAPVEVNAGQFTLRLNGKKQLILTQPAGMVVQSMKGLFGQGPNLVMSGGIGDGQVSVGGQQRQPRFPGDTTGTRQPRPVPVPEEDRPGVEKAPEAKPEDAVPAREFPNGMVEKPVAGYLFFPYGGKLKALKSIELIYESVGGTSKLSLQP